MPFRSFWCPPAYLRCLSWRQDRLSAHVSRICALCCPLDPSSLRDTPPRTDATRYVAHSFTATSSIGYAPVIEHLSAASSCYCCMMTPSGFPCLCVACDVSLCSITVNFPLNPLLGAIYCYFYFLPVCAPPFNFGLLAYLGYGSPSIPRVCM
jgi:hypothetical protein